MDRRYEMTALKKTNRRIEVKAVTGSHSVKTHTSNSPAVMKTSQKELEKRIKELESQLRNRDQEIEHLKESEEKYKTIFENANDEIIYVDITGIIVEINETCEALSGWTREELIGRHFSEFGFFSSADWDRSIEAFKDVIVGNGSTQRMEFEANRKDGMPIFVEVNSKLIRKNGVVKGVLSVMRDATERKQAEEALQESEEMARALLNATTDAVLLLDSKGTILDLNEAYADRFERNKDDMIGICLWDLLPEEAAINKRITDRVIETGKSMRFEQEYQGMWNNHVIYPVVDRRGKVSRVAIFSHDITKRKEAEEALRSHRDHLEDLVKERTDNIEETNTALKVLLKRREEDKNELEKKMLINVKELVLPFLEKLKNSRMNEKQSAFLNIMEFNLNDIISPFVRELSSKYLNLSATEIRIANIIKQGKTTKEIAELLTMSSRTVDIHRYNIRKKLGLNNKKASLATYLMSLR